MFSFEHHLDVVERTRNGSMGFPRGHTHAPDAIQTERPLRDFFAESFKKFVRTGADGISHQLVEIPVVEQVGGRVRFSNRTQRQPYADIELQRLRMLSLVREDANARMKAETLEGDAIVATHVGIVVGC